MYSLDLPCISLPSLYPSPERVSLTDHQSQIRNFTKTPRSISDFALANRLYTNKKIKKKRFETFSFFSSAHNSLSLSLSVSHRRERSLRTLARVYHTIFWLGFWKFLSFEYLKIVYIWDPRRRSRISWFT